MADKRRGLAVKKRPTASQKPGKRLVGNQWQNTPQQNKFMEHWLDASNRVTFGNQYQSALAAGYSEHYAKVIASKSVGNKWIETYINRSQLGIDQLFQVLNEMIIGIPDSKSPDDTKIKAIELLSKLKGLLAKEQVQQVVAIQVDLSSLGQDNRDNRGVSSHPATRVEA